MHPSKFFKYADIISDRNKSSELRKVLMNIHPKNIIPWDIIIAVYKIIIRYRTTKGNWKKSEKFILKFPGGGVEIT